MSQLYQFVYSVYNEFFSELFVLCQSNSLINNSIRFQCYYNIYESLSLCHHHILNFNALICGSQKLHNDSIQQIVYPYWGKKIDWSFPKMNYTTIIFTLRTRKSRIVDQSLSIFNCQIYGSMSVLRKNSIVVKIKTKLVNV